MRIEPSDVGYVVSLEDSDRATLGDGGPWPFPSLQDATGWAERLEQMIVVKKARVPRAPGVPGWGRQRVPAC
jgi:hypothetical protein